ncbi:MAG: four helix bundle protein [Planctomycetes bacterium]|nr:four helix bundle protein [Planctomycetota bacterium]
MGNETPTIFDHEKLDVYGVSLDFVAWSFSLAEKLKGPMRFARDQLLRASQSIPLNIAEGNGKRSLRDRGHFFEIARGSALECAALMDVLMRTKAIQTEEGENAKGSLQRIVTMLTGLINRSGEGVREHEMEYGVSWDRVVYEYEREDDKDD